MTRMPLVTALPRGLLWVITPDAAGNLVLCLAPGLSCRQRKEALRAYERACAHRPAAVGKATITGTAAIVAIVGIVAAMLAFAPARAPQRLRPEGSVRATPVRHHGRRREEATHSPRPRPEYVP